MTDDTADEVLARYRRRDPHVSREQALAMDTLSKRYAPLLASNREKARLRREEQLEETRRRIFGPGVNGVGRSSFLTAREQHEMLSPRRTASPPPRHPDLEED